MIIVIIKKYVKSQAFQSRRKMLRHIVKNTKCEFKLGVANVKEDIAIKS